MTAKIKTALLCKIFLVILIGFVHFSCGGGNGVPEKKISGTITANADGVVKFMYSLNVDLAPGNCNFTTDLPAPNNAFVLTVTSVNETATRTIENLTPGQKVKWTATAPGNPLNHGSGYFVHVIND